MARKTVMRRLSKRLPMSTDIEDALDRDETVPQIETTIEHDVQPLSRLDALEQHIAEDGVDTVTGEIVQEGRADAQHGDQFGEDAMAEQVRQETLAASGEWEE